MKPNMKPRNWTDSLDKYGYTVYFHLTRDSMDSYVEYVTKY
jgi:hypothetical protein